MASKIYEIAFKVAGKLSSDFAKTFSTAENSVDAFNDRLNGLNKQAAQTDKLVNLKKEVGEAAREYGQARQNIAKLGQAISKTSNPTKQQIAEFKQAESALAKAKGTLEKKRASLKDYENSVGSAGESMKTLIDRQKELAEQAEKARKALEKQQKLNEKIEKASAIQEKSKDVRGVGNTQIAALGGAAVGAGAFMVKAGTEYTQALNKMQAQTGATNNEMQKLSSSARELYKSGKGENFEAVTNAMVTTRQISGLAGDALQEVTGHALTMSKTFDFDVTESVRAASAMAKNLGISYDEAYGLIAYAAQNGANKNGDLLDTFNEYSVHFKAMGMSGQQFTQLLVAGAESGAFSIDKMGDAIKEFTIRSKDGSKNSLEAFEALGINGELATKKFAAGGDQAREAFFGVVEALDKIEDPVQKNAIGVQLFGTQFEDLEAGSLKAFASMQNASIDASGTLKNVGAVMGNDLGVALSRVQRGFSDALVPASESMAKSLTAKMPEIQASLSKLSPIIEKAAGAFASAMPSIVDAVSKAIAKVTDFATTIASNWGWIAPIVKGIVTAFVGFKAIAYAVSPIMTLYKGFLNLQKAINFAKNSTVLHTIATKAHTAVVKAGTVAQKALSSAFSTAKLVAHKVALAAHKAAIVAWKGACAIATGAQKAFSATFSAAKIVAQKAALVAHKVAMVAWSAACKAAAIAQKALSAAISFMSSPIGIAVAAIAGLIAIGVLLYKNWDKVKAKCSELWAAFAEKFPGMANVVKGAIGNIMPIINGLKKVLGGIIDFVAGVFTGNWSRAWSGIKNIFAGAWESLKGLAKAPLNGVISLVNRAIGALNNVSVKIPDWVPGFGGKSYGINIPKIPQLAEGGVATAPTLAMIGEGAESEAVLPLSKLDAMLGGQSSAGSSSMTVNFAPVINISGGSGDVADQVRQGLAEGQKNLKRELERLLRDQRRLSYV